MAGRPAKKDPSANVLRFEEAVEALETIIEEIEEGRIGLEESISAYQRGMSLLARCREVLDQAEQQIERLTAPGSAEGDSGQSTES